MDHGPPSLELIPGECALIRMTSHGPELVKLWASEDLVPTELLVDLKEIDWNPTHPLSDILTRLRAQ